MRGGWAGLPSALFRLVSGHLYAPDHFRAERVCRHWQGALAAHPVHVVLACRATALPAPYRERGAGSEAVSRPYAPLAQYAACSAGLNRLAARGRLRALYIESALESAVRLWHTSDLSVSNCGATKKEASKKAPRLPAGATSPSYVRRFRDVAATLGLPAPVADQLLAVCYRAVDDVAPFRHTAPHNHSLTVYWGCRGTTAANCECGAIASAVLLGWPLAASATTIAAALDAAFAMVLAAVAGDAPIEAQPVRQAAADAAAVVARKTAAQAVVEAEAEAEAASPDACVVVAPAATIHSTIRTKSTGTSGHASLRPRACGCKSVADYISQQPSSAATAHGAECGAPDIIADYIAQRISLTSTTATTTTTATATTATTTTIPEGAETLSICTKDHTVAVVMGPGTPIPQFAVMCTTPAISSLTIDVTQLRRLGQIELVKLTGLRHLALRVPFDVTLSLPRDLFTTLTPYAEVMEVDVNLVGFDCNALAGAAIVEARSAPATLRRLITYTDICPVCKPSLTGPHMFARCHSHFSSFAANVDAAATERVCVKCSSRGALKSKQAAARYAARRARAATLRHLAAALDRRSVVAFGADGVLLVPWGAPARAFPTARRLLEMLSRMSGVVDVFVASFNHKVPEILERAQLSHLYGDIRAGSNAEWQPPYDRAVHRRDMCRALQLANMLDLAGGEASDLVYFDDDLTSVRKVRVELPEARVVYVRSTRGVTMEDFWQATAAHFVVNEEEEAATHAANLLSQTVVEQVRIALGGPGPATSAAGGDDDGVEGDRGSTGNGEDNADEGEDDADGGDGCGGEDGTCADAPTELPETLPAPLGREYDRAHRLTISYYFDD